MNTRILLVEDHQVVREGFQLILQAEEKLDVIGSLGNGSDVLPFLLKHPIDFVLLDIDLPGVNGLILAQEIRKHYPAIRILILTFHNKAAYIKEIISTGADGYVLKNAGKDQVLKAIYHILEGETYFSKEATDTLVKSYQRQGTKKVIEPTKRELEVMILLAKGYTINEIADQFSRASHTVETHRRNAYAKMNFKNKADLTRYITENGYLDVDDKTSSNPKKPKEDS